jgi:ATP-dependent DNA helicase RecQ
VSPQTVTEAVAFLERTNLFIEPRRMWPPGGLSTLGVSGKIDAALLAQRGMALCRWGDAGWGQRVRQGKYDQERFHDELVVACARMVKEWAPVPEPSWVTYVPSLRHPDLVSDFARRLADELGLLFVAALRSTGERPPQKSMANSAQQARNLDGAFELSSAALPAGPVLLIDDMVDSRWTFTVAAWLLRKGGSGEVWPLALASTGPGR